MYIYRGDSCTKSQQLQGLFLGASPFYTQHTAMHSNTATTSTTPRHNKNPIYL